MTNIIRSARRGDDGVVSRVPQMIGPYLATDTNGVVILLAPHDFEPERLDWQPLRAQHSNLHTMFVALEGHRALQGDRIGCDEYLTLAAEMRSGLRALGRGLWRFVRHTRQAHPTLAVSWFPGERFVVLEVVFELLTLLTGASRCLLIDDIHGIVRELTWPYWLTRRLPRAFTEWMVTPGLLAGLWLIAWAGQRYPKRPRVALMTQQHPPRRVLYVQTDLDLARGATHTGGAAAHVQGMIGGFQQNGAEVTVIATGPSAALQSAKTAPAIVRPWGFIALPWELLEVMTNFPVLRAARRVAKRIGPDLIYQRHAMNAFSGVALGRLLGLPVVLEANSAEVRWRRQHARLILPRLAQAIERMAFRQADVLVAVSERVRDDLMHEGAEAEKILVLANAADPQHFYPGVDPAPVRSQYGLTDAVVVGFVGSFYPWHGIDVLAQAMRTVLAERPQVRLLLVGTGKYRQHIDVLAADPAFRDQVIRVGSVPYEAVPAYLAAMDIVTAAHAAEPGFIGSPIKLFEYMAMGKAIVASDLEQLGQIITDGRNGLLVQPGDANELAAALVRLIDDPDLRQQLGCQARRDLLAQHTWEGNVRALLHFLAQRASPMSHA